MTLGKHGKLFTAFSFLRLNGDDLVWYQWVYPTILYVLVYSCLFFLADTYPLVDVKHPIADITALAGILVGFYILVLTAICGMKNENLDKPIKGRGVKMKFIRGGDRITEPLTRRRFLAVLFGYCAALSGIIWLFGVFSVHADITYVDISWIAGIFDFSDFPGFAAIFGWVFYIVYTWMLCSLSVVTLLGLHYLVDRIHRS